MGKKWLIWSPTIQEYEKRIEDMEEAREKALQEVTDHYETKLVEKEQQREQVRQINQSL